MSDLVKQSVATAALTTATHHLENALMEMATALSDPSAAPETVARLLAILKDHEAATDTLASLAKKRVLEYLTSHGEISTQAGSRTAQVGDYILEARVQSRQYDAKRVESLLRARGLDPAHHMDMHITFKVNEAKLERLVADLHADGSRASTFVPEELEACRAPLQYAVQRPRFNKE